MNAWFKKIYECKGISTVRGFVDGRFFPFVVGGLVALFSICSLPLVSLAVMLAFFTFVFLFSEDTRAALPIAIFFFFSLDYYQNENAYLSTEAMIVYCLFALPALLSLVFRLVVFKCNSFKPTIFIGLVLMCVGFLLGGAFTKYYQIYNFYKCLGLLVAFTLPYLVFSLTMKYREDTILYFARICAIGMGIIIVQLMKIYLKNYTWGMPLDNLWKYKIVLGWGISNTIGEFIVVFMPAVFYLIHKEKRGYLYYILLAVAYIAVLLTLSRNALLFGTLTIGVGILANCFIGRHKKTHRYVVLSVILIAVLMLCVLLFIGKFKDLFTFFIENGFSDRGRFKMWRDYVAYFKKSPIVGAGFAEFRDLYYNKWVDTAWQAHNTPIQVLGSTGLVGAIFYCIHRTQTAALLLRKPKSDRLFIGGCMAVLLLQSLLDPLFFRLYIAIFYSSLLWIIEQSYREDKLPLAK